MRKRLVAGFGVLMIVAAIAVAASTRLFTLVVQPASGPTTLTWYAAGGRVMPAWFSGCFGDPGLELATWRGGAIVTCDNEAIDRGWAFLDPAQKTAKLLWPVPRDGGMITTVGLVPGPNDQLAIAFERAGDLRPWVGIAGPAGWLREPAPVDYPAYWAGAWIGDVLQVVAGPERDTEGQVSGAMTVVTINGVPQQDVSFGPCRQCAPPGPIAIYRAAGHWIYEVADTAYTDDGGKVPALHIDPTLPVDRLAHGALVLPAFNHDRTPPVITRAGKLVPGTPPPRPELHPDHLQRVAIRPDGEIVRTPTWHLGNHRGDFAELDHRLVAWWIADQELRIADVPTDYDAIPTVPPVARWPRSFGLRVLIPDATGAWMLDSAGERIHLDARLHRTDAVPLATCLRHHACTDRSATDDATAMHALRWLHFGLPLLVAAYLLLSFAARHRPRLVIFALLAAGYLGGAAWAIDYLLPRLSALG